MHVIKLIDQFIQDLRYALRYLHNNLRFTVMAVLIMALGIGANTAVFSVVNQVLLKPLSYPDPDRIVRVSTDAAAVDSSSLFRQVASADFEAWKGQSTAFDAMALYGSRRTSVGAGSFADSAQVSRVSADFFSVLGVQPALGRAFTTEETVSGGPPAAIISYAYWQNRLGGTGAALGQLLRMFGNSAAIVGVMPAGFQFPDDTDVWIPAMPDPLASHGLNYLAVGRLKTTASIEGAQAELRGISQRLEQQYPEFNIGRSVSLQRLHDDMVGDVRWTIYLLWAAAGVVLLIASANTATLLLSRGASRMPEIAVRAAVGASRGRVIRQLLTENLVLAVLAGGAGLIFARVGLQGLLAAAPATVPRLGEVTIDQGVMVFTILASGMTSLIFGLIPAFHVAKVDLNESLKQGTSRLMSAGSASRTRAVLVIAEIGLSVLLLCTAGLLIRSFVALNNVALGFQPEQVLLMEARAASLGLPGANSYFQETLRKISELQGVVAAGGTMAPPGRIDSRGSYFPDQIPPGELRLDKAPMAIISVTTPGVFPALGIPVTSGRDFNDTDTETSPPTVVINEMLARAAFSGRDPLGRKIVCLFDSLEPMTVVGVVGNVRQAGPATEPGPECYLPYRQHPYNGLTLSVAIRTSGEAAAMIEPVRRIARETSPEVAVDFVTMETALAQNVSAPRFRMLLLGTFAALAISLAMAGVYSIVAYAIAQRSREIGLRMAMGATSGAILSMVLRQGARLAIAGVTAGLIAAFAVTRLLSAMLFGIQPGDPLTYITVAAVVGAVTLAATYLPARRASKIDPLIALRQD